MLTGFVWYKENIWSHPFSISSLCLQGWSGINKTSLESSIFHLLSVPTGFVWCLKGKTSERKQVSHRPCQWQTLMKDQPDGKSPCWKTTLMKTTLTDHLMRTTSTDHPDEDYPNRPPWWRSPNRLPNEDHPNKPPNEDHPNRPPNEDHPNKPSWWRPT